VRKVGSYYYLYYSVSSFGVQDSAIGIAYSSTMDYGTWKDLGSTAVASSSAKPYNAIDPNLIQVGSSYYMTFGSYWKGIYQVQMASNPKAVAGTAKQLVSSSDGEVIEGAYIFKYGSYYYLFYSKGSCCGYDATRPAAGKEYRILVCRSTSATGGFKDKNGVACTSGGGTAVLASHGYVYGPGGQGVYQDPTYGPVLYYHYGASVSDPIDDVGAGLALTCLVCVFYSGHAYRLRGRRQEVRLEPD
jgi:arabinan endo-1,5-alpha-L-arabinosidase